MSDMDAMRGRANRLTGLNLERMRGLSSRLNTDTLDAGVWIAVDSIITDDAIQVRVGRLDAAKVESYTEALKAGAEFPPIDVFRDGSALYLADGFHRLAAHKAAGESEILAVVRPGGYEEAYAHAESANLLHGLELSMDDKKNIYFRRLARRFWDDSKTSMREIAKAFGVNASTISRWRREYESGEVTIEGVASATPAEDYEKPQKASTRKKGGRKPAKKRAPTQLQLRQRALKNLHTAADALAALDMGDHAMNVDEYADQLAAEWGMD